MIFLALSTWKGSAHDLSATLWLAPLGVALAVSALLTPLAILIACRLGIVDRPSVTKIHKKVTPLLGGVAVYAAFAIVAAMYLPLQGPVRGILAGGAVAVAVGVIDDRFKLTPLVHLGGQILAAGVAVVTGLGYVHFVSNPFETAAHIAAGHGSWTTAQLGVWGAPVGIAFTLFWIVGMMNTVNFLDGLDGLSSGVAILVALTLAVYALNPANDFRGHVLLQFNHASAVLPIILIGALLGFLFFNWNPARIFIGDSGALFVGLALGAISVFGIAKIGTALVIISIPILDVAWAIVRRTLHGKSFLAGDKQHVYHRMVELGMSPKAVVLTMYAVCAIIEVIDLRTAHLDRLVLFVVIGLMAALGFVALEIAGNRKKASDGRRDSAQKVQA